MSRIVLIVEDDQDLRGLLQTLLRESGLRVQTARNALEALELARAAHFDAVLSDLHMPQKDGLDLVRELREIQPETPVILMSAAGTAATPGLAREAGAFDYLVKPFRRQQLLSALGRAFEPPSRSRTRRRPGGPEERT